jgi:predicted dehydrogenase
LKQVLQHVRSGELRIAEVPEPHCKGGGVVVRNAASLISAGTERMVIEFAGKSMIGKARERPDLVRQVADKVRKDGLGPTMETVMSKLDQPIPLGYSCAGIVESVGRGAEEFAVGDRVACAGMGYASHANAVFVPKNLCVRVPEGVSLEDASYVTLGAIALQSVRIAEVRLGEKVVVIGLGLLGQLAVQILKASGCRVLGIDLDPAKLELAKQMGADQVVSRAGGVEAAVEAFTSGVGADAVVIAAATDSNDPIELAGELSRDRGRVVMLGAVKMDIPRKIYYDKELELRLSRSYGPGRYDPEYEEKGHDYPIAYVRWTERRNMQEFLELIADGKVTPARLTTHRFPIDEAEAAYDIVTGKTEARFLGIILTYPEAIGGEQLRTVAVKPRRLGKGVTGRGGRTGIGFIGAGNFARAVLLPRFSRSEEATLVGMATATGVNATTAAEKFGFGYGTTDTPRLLSDPDIAAVVIATRHDSHSRFAASALRAGKSVFLEKPLAIDEQGLQEVLEAQAESDGVLSVGFNRRFSPFSEYLRNEFASAGPLAITYRVNAGPIPRESWVHDPVEGGGRIIGEMCHFIDLAQYLADDLPTEVFAYSLGGEAGALHDTVSVVLRFGRGTVANINYFATGDKSFAKERVEIYGGGAIGVLDDFRSARITRGGKRKKMTRFSQEKGFDGEIAAFLAAVRGEKPAPISLESLIATTRATFAIEESLRTGVPVRISAA